MTTTVKVDRGARAGALGWIPSPYNFVPVNRRVFFPPWAERASHDRPFKDGVCGTFEIEIALETPLFVRGANGGFPRMPNGEPFVPGSSVRGMVRNVVEIASFGKLRAVDDRRFGVRDLQNRELYLEHMAQLLPGGKGGKKQPVPLVSAGWLQRRPSDPEHPAEIVPCHFAKIEYALLKQVAAQAGVNGFEPGRRQSAAEKYRRWGNRPREVWVEVDVLRRADDEALKRKLGAQWVSAFGKVRKARADSGASLKSGAHKGVLVFTGQPSRYRPNTGKKRKRAGNAKHHDFVFYGEAGEPFRIAREAFEDFEFIHADTGQQHRRSAAPNEEWGYWQKAFLDGKPVPVFFILEKHSGTLEVRSFGLAMMFRLAYRYSVHDALRNAQPEFDDRRFDLPELIFGRSPDEERGEVGLKGRVSIGHAHVDGAYRWGSERSMILGAPKPSFYPNYLEQHTDASGRKLAPGRGYTTFMDKDVRLRGWKRYRPAPQDDDPFMPESVKNNEKVKTRFRPLEPGARFRARVRVHNLRPAELGALLWAIDFGGDEKARHMLGLAKPYGYGRVRLRVVEASIALRRMDDTPLDPKACEGCVKAFEETMDRFWQEVTGDAACRWRESDVVRALLALALPARDRNEVRYPRLDPDRRGNEFADAKRKEWVLKPPVAFQDPDLTQPAGDASSEDDGFDAVKEAIDERFKDGKAAVCGEIEELFALIEQWGDRLVRHIRKKKKKRAQWEKWAKGSPELERLVARLYPPKA